MRINVEPSSWGGGGRVKRGIVKREGGLNGGQRSKGGAVKG